MNWEAIGAVAEAGGAVAVVLSLLYLSVQIRQNTRAVRGSTAHAVTERQQVELHWSHEIASIFAKAIETPDQLNSAEAWSLSEWLTAAIVMRQNEFRQYRLGLLDEDSWKQAENVILMVLSLTWARNWWYVLGREQVQEDLAARIDELLATTELSDWSAGLAALKDLRELKESGPSSAGPVPS
ncbi:MAG: hypothetical protein P8177_09405 [Gemmatimonadota bacterium]|jgi:hypothetical protein